MTELLMGTSKNSQLARRGRFLEAQEEFLNGGVSKAIHREKNILPWAKKISNPKGKRFLWILASSTSARSYRLGYALVIFSRHPPIIYFCAPFVNF